MRVLLNRFSIGNIFFISLSLRDGHTYLASRDDQTHYTNYWLVSQVSWKLLYNSRPKTNELRYIKRITLIDDLIMILQQTNTYVCVLHACKYVYSSGQLVIKQGSPLLYLLFCAERCCRRNDESKFGWFGPGMSIEKIVQT